MRTVYLVNVISVETSTEDLIYYVNCIVIIYTFSTFELWHYTFDATKQERRLKQRFWSKISVTGYKWNIVLWPRDLKLVTFDTYSEFGCYFLTHVDEVENAGTTPGQFWSYSSILVSQVIFFFMFFEWNHVCFNLHAPTSSRTSYRFWYMYKIWRHA